MTGPNVSDLFDFLWLKFLYFGFMIYIVRMVKAERKNDKERKRICGALRYLVPFVQF